MIKGVLQLHSLLLECMNLDYRQQLCQTLCQYTTRCQTSDQVHAACGLAVTGRMASCDRLM